MQCLPQKISVPGSPFREHRASCIHVLALSIRSSIINTHSGLFIRLKSSSILHSRSRRRHLAHGTLPPVDNSHRICFNDIGSDELRQFYSAGPAYLCLPTVLTSDPTALAAGRIRR
jgi:hypothetical protein